MRASRRHALVSLAGSAAGAAWPLLVAPTARAQPSAAAPAEGERWARIHASVFESRAIATAEPAQLQIVAPARAVDAAFVPVTVRTGAQAVKRLTLVVDENPSPIAAVFDFGTRAAPGSEIETRLRVDAYSWVRAVAELPDGRLVMAARYVKASGGCSAPAGADQAAAMASLGRMQLRVEAPRTGRPTLATWQISHPNHSGLAMDQSTRLYTPAHFVRKLELRYAGEPVLLADLDFALSENPSLRLRFVPGGPGELRADAEDTQGRRFSTALAVEPAP